jgi:predicted unusual protein kinase regulating ubiquinone biosynthesis (AarF/ABC1/UbiB family)
VSDDNSLGGRVKRYAQVAGAMGGLGAKLAGERYLGISIDRGKHAGELTAALGGIKGPLMKVAQLLSTIPEALPREYAEQLAQLQADAPAMGWPFVKRRMASELGPDWRDKFAEFEPQAASAASLGQVHRATAHDGTKLAVKLQYPDMASAVEADLSQLKIIFAIVERYSQTVSTGDIRAEIADRLREELDYRREAKNMALYGLMLEGEPTVHVPYSLPDLSTGRLLTMNWLDGEKLMDWTERSQADRDRLALTMFRAWYVPFYYYGVIHGDPHPGNYSVRPDGSVNLLDFGCIRVFRPAFVGGVIDLYHALMRNDAELAVHAYETWGFGNLTKELIDSLNIWARFLYAPLMEDRDRRIQELPSGTNGREIAEKVALDLKRLGGIKPPREFVFMDRAAIGLGSVFTHLKAEINWHRLFLGMIDDFSVEALAKRQKAAVAAAGLGDLTYS